MSILNKSTAKETISIIKANGIAKGCKITFVSNKVFIYYPIYKTLNGQYATEKRQIENVLPLCTIECYKIQNKGGINIWLNN